jgi:hypothetical protein
MSFKRMDGLYSTQLDAPSRAGFRVASRLEKWGIPASSAIFRLKPSMCLPAIFFHGGARARSPDEAQHCTSFGP